MTGLIQHLLLTALLAVGVAVVCRFARSRPAVCHGLWLLVLVKLAIPPGLVAAWRVPVVLPAFGSGTSSKTSPDGPATRTASRETVAAWPASASPETTVPLEGGSPAPVEPTRDCSVMPRSNPATVASNASGPTLDDVLFSAIVLLWIGGTVLSAGAHGLRLRRFRPLLARASPAPESLERTVRAVAGRLGVKAPETVVVGGSLSPILWCVGRPRLVWPEALFDRLPPEAWSDIVAHELAHLRRRDHWVGWLLLAAGFVWWWNPLFWIIRRRLHFWAELACDAWVVKLRPAGRRRFARTLIEVSRIVSRAARPLPAMGMSAAAFQELERRLTMILHHRTAERVPLWGAFLLAILGLAVLPGLSFSQDDDKPRKKKKVRAETVAEVPVKRGAATEAMEDVVEDIQEVEEDVIEEPVDSAASRRGRSPGFTPAMATGAPNTMGSGLKSTAWTPLRSDAGEEWLLLRYRYRVQPRAVRIYETDHPGAVVRVCAVVGDNAEVLLWAGEDPVPPGQSHAISTIRIDTRPDLLVATRMIKIYLDTKRVKGRNAIDAVELLGKEGPQFAHRAWASSYLPRARPGGRAGVSGSRSGRGGRAHFFGRATRPVEAESALTSRSGRRRGNVAIASGGGVSVTPSGSRSGPGRRTLRAPTAGGAAAEPSKAPPDASWTRPPTRRQPDPVPESRILKLERELEDLKKMIRRLEKKLGSDI